MKKLIILVCAIAAVILSGCKKDEKQEEFSLTGKTYAISSPRFGTYDSWKFISDTELEVTFRDDNPQGSIRGEIEYGTYTLDYPNMTVKVKESNTLMTYECEFISETCFRTTMLAGYNYRKIFEFYKQ